MNHPKRKSLSSGKATHYGLVIFVDTHHPILISAIAPFITHARGKNYTSDHRKITYRLWLGSTRFSGIREVTADGGINVSFFLSVLLITFFIFFPRLHLYVNCPLDRVFKKVFIVSNLIKL